MHNPLGTATYYEVGGRLHPRSFQERQRVLDHHLEQHRALSANLYIGIYDVNGNREVDEDFLNTPWTKVLSSAGTRDGNDLITYVVMGAASSRSNFAHWFAGYKNLTDLTAVAVATPTEWTCRAPPASGGPLRGRHQAQIVGNIPTGP